MAARLVRRERIVFSDGSLVQMMIWELPSKTMHFPQGIKYRLYYGNASGLCLVRYDNERGKGHHRHYGPQLEEPYRFVDVETLMRDFLADVASARGNKV